MELYPIKPRGQRYKRPSCLVDECDRESRSVGLCGAHYAQKLRGKPLGPIRPPKWGEGWTVKRTGYRFVRVGKDHPNADRNGVMAEHRYVMTVILGRALLPGENVHHKNGVRDDNRPENLELWLTHQPKGQRLDEVLLWVVQLSEQYADEIKAIKEAP